MLSCGHPDECSYFHPALIAGSRFRCVACDDPKQNTVASKKLVEQGILEDKSNSIPVGSTREGKHVKSHRAIESEMKISI